MNKDTASPILNINKGKSRNKKGNNSGVTMSYMKCLKNRSPKLRKQYCKQEFQGLPGVQIKCEVKIILKVEWLL